MDLSEITSLAIPDAASLTRSADAAMRMAESFTIVDPEDYTMAAEELRSIKGKIKSLEEKRTSITGPLTRAHKAVMDLFRGPMDRLVAAEVALKSSMIAFDNKKEAEERVAREQAERVAAAERERLAAEERALQERQAEEQRARDRAAAQAAQAAAAEQARLRREAEAASGAERERAEAELRAAQEREDAEAVERARIDTEAANARQAEIDAVQLTQAVVSAPAVALMRPQAGGISKKVKRVAKVVDIARVVRFVAANPQFLPILHVDEVRLRGFVVTGQADVIDGIVIEEVKSIAARAA